MIYLLLSILFASFIFVIFRSFSNYSVNTFTAIVINYTVAAIIGFIIPNEAIEVSQIISAGWISNALILGGSFIASFYLMAITAQRLGASVASVANKMSVIIPVFFAFWLYNDSINVYKILGIILALIGLYWATKKEKVVDVSRQWLLPVSLFIFSGLLDTYVKHTQHLHLTEDSNSTYFIPTLFTAAAAIGWIISLFQFQKLRKTSVSTIIGGVVLGGVNYLSIIFIFKALAHDNMESSVVFPINNMGVVLFTSLFSIAFFKERLTKMNFVGLIVCFVAIALIAWGI